MPTDVNQPARCLGDRRLKNLAAHDLTNRLTLENLHLGFTQLANNLLRLKTLLGHPDFPRIEMLTKLEF